MTQTPNLVNNQLTINQFETKVLTNSDLLATDGTVTTDKLYFSVADIQHGYFALANAPTVAITAFTQQQINQGEIVFVQDQSANTPTYLIAVSNGQATTEFSRAVVTSTAITLGSEFRINTYTTIDQASPAVTALRDGGFVVTWQSNGQDGSGYGIYGQRYTSSGATVGSEFRINTYTTTDQASPAITALSDGGFVVTWNSNGQDGSLTGIYGQRYASSGAIMGSEFRINTYTTGNQQFPAITSLSDGGFVVTWQSSNQDGSGFGIYGQRYASNGATVGSEFRINSYVNSSQQSPAITALSDGGFVVTWQSLAQDGSGYGIYGQRYASNGATVGSEFRVNSYVNSSQQSPAITALSDGGFVVTWQSLAQDGSDYGIYGQRYASSGATVGSEFRINTYTTDQQMNPAIAGLSDGEFVITWQSNLQDGSGYGIHGQRFSGTSIPLPQLALAAFTLAKGQTKTLDSTLVTMSTSRVGASLSCSVASVTHGQFELVQTPGVAITSFTQAELDAGAVCFVHDGSDHAPLFSLKAVDGSYSSAIIQGKTNTTLAYPPLVLQNNLQLIVTDSLATTLSQAHLKTTGSAAEIVTYHVTGTDNGILEWADHPGTSINSFTQALIDSGKINIVSATATIAPQFSLRAQNGYNLDIAFSTDTLLTEQAALGNEFRVNTYTTEQQMNPAIAGLSDGGFVVIWHSDGQDSNYYYDSYGQCYDSSGATVGSEFRINTYTTDQQMHPAITALSDGGFIVTWQSSGQDGSGEGIYGQRYTSSGAAVGNEFRINTYTFDSQMYPAIAGLSDGGFVVTWQSNGQDGSGYGIYGQCYASNGATVGSEFRINTYTTYDQTSPTITGLSDGGFVVTWQSNGQDGSGYGIYGQRYASDGTTIGSEFRINTYTFNPQMYPAIAGLSDGGFVVAWQSNGQDGSYDGIYGQRYASNGATVGNEFRINTYTLYAQASPAITVLSDGGFVVTWQSANQDGNSDGIYGQRYASSGATVGKEFRINTYTFAEQINPAIAGLSDGGFVVTWQSVDQDGSGFGIYGQRFSVKNSPHWQANALSLSEGQTLVLNSTYLAAQSASALTYTASNVANGRFELVANPGIAITSFTQAAINAGQIQFVHDGGEQAPQYQLMINDGYFTTSNRTSRVTFQHQNDAPVITSSAGEISFFKGEAALVIDNGLLLSDIDNAELQSATVRITSGFVAGEDVLAFTDQNGITGSYSNGVLTLTGSASVANYQAALRSLTYRNTNVQSPNTQARTISFVVNDGVADSNTVSRGVSIVAVNEAPVITMSSGAIRFTEKGAPVIVDTGVTLSDVDNTSLAGATISISGRYVATEDELLFTNQHGITGSYSNGVLSLTGSASVANYQTALRSVQYRNTNQQNPNTAARTISMQVSDGQANSNTASRGVNIVAVNDAPVIQTSSGSASFTEGGDALVIDSGLTVSDVDNTYLQSATVRISQGLVASEDVLAFTNQAGITGSYDKSTGTLTLTGSALLADYQAALRSVTYVNTSQNPNTQARTLSFVVNDGQAESAEATRSLTVIAVNNAPVITLSSGSISFTEKGAPVAVDSGLVVSDVDSAELTGASVSISNGLVAEEDELLFTAQHGISGSYDSASGSLTLTGNASVANYQTALRSITYRNTNLQTPNTQARTIRFVVNDGQALSATVSRSLNVITMNDAPVITLSHGPISFTEKGTAVTIDSGLTLSDVDNGQLVNATVRISQGLVAPEDELSVRAPVGIASHYDSQSGILSLTGQANVTDYQAALRAVTYRNRNEANPHTQPRTVEFVVHDGELNSQPANRTVNVIAVNDAPVVVNALPEQQLQAGTPFNFSLPVDTFLDVDDARLSLTAEQADGQALPSWISFDAASQTFNGTALSAGVANFTVTAQDSQGARASLPVNLAIAAKPEGLSLGAQVGIGVGVGAAGLGVVGVAAGAAAFGLFKFLTNKKSTSVTTPSKDLELGEMQVESGKPSL